MRMRMEMKEDSGILNNHSLQLRWILPSTIIGLTMGATWISNGIDSLQFSGRRDLC